MIASNSQALSDACVLTAYSSALFCNVSKSFYMTWQEIIDHQITSGTTKTLCKAGYVYSAQARNTRHRTRTYSRTREEEIIIIMLSITGGQKINYAHASMHEGRYSYGRLSVVNTLSAKPYKRYIIVCCLPHADGVNDLWCSTIFSRFMFVKYSVDVSFILVVVRQISLGGYQNGYFHMLFQSRFVLQDKSKTRYTVMTSSQYLLFFSEMKNHTTFIPLHFALFIDLSSLQPKKCD